MKARATAVAAAAVIASLAAGCGSSSTSALQKVPPTTGASTPSVSPTPSESPTPAPTLPLTGLPASGGNRANRVVAVSLVGVAGRPAPIGLGQAETVYVEYSDNLRLLALFQSVDAKNVGPVGPTRPADGPILGVLHPIYANTGGPAGFVTLLDQSAVSDASSAREPAAFVPVGNTLFTSVAGLRHAVPAPSVPPPLLTFASAGDRLGAGAQQAHTVTITVPGYPAVQWNYNAKVNRWGTSAAIFGFARPASLIVQQVAYKTVQLHHPDGAYVPSARVYGHGSATVLSGASAVRGLWSKPGSEAITVFSDSTGVPLKLRAGPAWVLLVPAGTQVAYK